MTTSDLIKRLFFILLMLKTGGTVMAAIPSDTELPVTPEVPATPGIHGQTNTQNTVQHVTHNKQNISMQIMGETPVINDQASASLSFAAGSYIQATIKAMDNVASMELRWDSIGCIATQAGKSRSCNRVEREQILNLVQQLPTPPTPPAR